MKKRFLALFVCLVMLCGTVPMTVSAAAAPVIALTYTPAYGSSDSFEGQVFMENGGSFDTADYRISLYLQLTAGDTYWVKPTYSTPYATLTADGRFSIRYATGGTDQNAAVIHIMLIPASFTPSSDFTRTKNAALDYVKITRTAKGDVTVNPARSLPDKTVQVNHTSGLTVSSSAIAVNVGFYTDGSKPGDALPRSLMLQQLSAVAQFADTVRLFASSGELYKAYQMANDMGFSVVGTAWLCGDKAADKAELNALIEHCNNGLVKVACVGSETLLREDLTAEELIGYIQYVRDNLKSSAIPVTTAESVDILLENPSVRASCDILMPNCYPYWAGAAETEALSLFTSAMNSLIAKADGKEILVSETGWPTAGQTIGKAVAGEAEAAAYFESIRAWSLSTHIPVFWFDAADEPWKSADEGASGAHWGFMTTDMQLKESFAKTAFFRLALGKTGLSNFSKINTYRDGQFGDVAASGWYSQNVAAIYGYGLMNGTSATAFAPLKSITVAEAVTLACRIHDIYYGQSTVHTGGSKWYDGYVQHAIREGILYRGQFSDYDRPALRSEVAQLLAAALPPFELNAVSTSVTVPDVSKTAAYYKTVLALYQAGILTGTADGSFRPDRTVTRAEVAAIATRIIDPSLRMLKK